MWPDGHFLVKFWSFLPLMAAFEKKCAVCGIMAAFFLQKGAIRPLIVIFFKMRPLSAIWPWPAIIGHLAMAGHPAMAAFLMKWPLF